VSGCGRCKQQSLQEESAVIELVGWLLAGGRVRKWERESASKQSKQTDRQTGRQVRKSSHQTRQ
jgi:hypothetical protein